MISVIVPVYNVAPYLRRCVDSILAQTYRDLDIILVDDGSTDESGAICDDYAARDNRVRVLHTANGGPGTARNRGFELARGDIIAFPDSDDYLEPTMYATMLAAMGDEYDIVICGGFKHNIDGTIQPHLVEDREMDFRGDEMLAQLTLLPAESSTVMAVPWNRLCRLRLLRDNNLRFAEDITSAEDRLFSVQLYATRPRGKFIPARLYHYVKRPTSLSERPPLVRALMMLTAWERVRVIVAYRDDLAERVDGHLIRLVMGYLKHNTVDYNADVLQFKDADVCRALYEQSLRIPRFNERVLDRRQYEQLVAFCKNSPQLTHNAG